MTRLTTPLATRLLTAVLVIGTVLCATAGGASAQDAAAPVASARSGRHGGGPFGVGGIAYLSSNGASGLSLVYDPGAWHIDTILGFHDNPSFIQVGGRFWYHVHSASSADLSVGGGLDYQRTNPSGPAPATTFLFVEVGGLIRVFLASNVALGAAAGMILGTADANGYSVGNASLVASAALHYFF